MANKVYGLPDVKVGRCKFSRPFKNHTTWNNGELNVLAYDCNVTPGDTIEIPISAIVRTQTPLYPVMDNMFFDVSVWFVPDRLLWKNFKAFWGENNETYWEEPSEYETPQIVAPDGGFAVKSLAEHLGVTPGVPGVSTSHMPIRAYCHIWNEFFRDENLKEPIFVNDDETTLTGKNYGVGWDYTTDTQLGGKLMKVARTADFFSKSLPEPQKGPDVIIPLGDTAPVLATSDQVPAKLFNQANAPLNWSRVGNVPLKNPGFPYVDALGNTELYQPQAATGWQDNGPSAPANLWADLSNATAATIRDLRLAVSLQRYYEQLARSGSRYIEVLAGIFGIESSDKTLQRPQFIGGHRYPLNMTQVVATAEGTNNDLGETGAMSQTIIKDYLGTFSAEEHGVLMILGCTRVEHTYSYGIPKMLLRKNKFDYYNRALDHIGEESVYNIQVYAQGPSAIDSETGKPYDDGTFGYQPRYEDMRVGISMCTGEFRPQYTTPLTAWTYQDVYTELPTLSSDWIDEGPENVDRTLKVTSETADQIFGDFYFDMKWTRGMSMYGTPGFMDHM